MSNRRTTRAKRHAEKLRRKRRRLAIELIAAGLCLAALLMGASLARRRGDTPAPPVPRPVGARDAASPAPLPSAAEPSAEAMSTAPSPTPAPTAVPEPTRTPWPRGMPNALSFYRPVGDAFSRRARLGDTFSAPWHRGEDIASFEVAASDAEALPAGFFGETFGDIWNAFPRSGECFIGYTLRYTLKDGEEIRYSMLAPKHIRHTEYLEVWLYDDLHHSGNEFYSHLTGADSDTVVTSIKLTCGEKIADVREIWLTAFVCSSRDEFDADWNYIGDVSCTVRILENPAK